MHFEDSPEEAQYRAKVRAWLEQNLPSEADLAGLDEVGQNRMWQKRLFDAGWACLTWPKEYGGQDATPIQQIIWGQEEARVKTPISELMATKGLKLFAIGQDMAAPTLMTWGTDEQQRRYLPRLASGEDLWCQLFSEPAGGSDLAALRTSAVRDGDEWVINGQKTWTSFAHDAEYGVLVTRTDPTLPKHKGLTYFVVDMRSPGIEVKPIRQITGRSHFNEVYFDDVRIPDENRVGEVGNGWKVALSTLMNERAIFTGGMVTSQGVDFWDAYDLARKVSVHDRPAIEEGSIRAKLANWYVQEAGLKFAGLRSITALSRGENPSSENSVGKLVVTVKEQEMAAFCMDLLEMDGVIQDNDLEEQSARFQEYYFAAAGGRIAGGTDEVQAGIIAERVMGLPQEPRADKGIPFTDIPTSSSS